MATAGNCEIMSSKFNIESILK